MPVSEALLGIEKLILDKKAYATVVGNFRSEALLAAMDIYSKYKVVNIGTIAMVPKFEELVAAEKAKYKYSYRMCLDSKYLAATIQGLDEVHQQRIWLQQSIHRYSRRALGRRNGSPHGEMVQRERLDGCRF